MFQRWFTFKILFRSREQDQRCRQTRLEAPSPPSSTRQTRSLRSTMLPRSRVRWPVPGTDWAELHPWPEQPQCQDSLNQPQPPPPPSWEQDPWLGDLNLCHLVTHSTVRSTEWRWVGQEWELRPASSAPTPASWSLSVRTTPSSLLLNPSTLLENPNLRMESSDH